MKLVARRRSEVNAKLQSLETEFKYWKEITEDGLLSRHHSQVRRLTATLLGSLEPLKAELKNAGERPEVILQDAEAWENQILAAHAIWEVFRSKLVLREDELFALKLAACDDLAWECYFPALSRWDTQRKGPPLVYFSSTWSPFAMISGGTFMDQVRVGRSTASALGEEHFQRVLKALPVSLVSLPWYQVFHLPGTLVIAHEVGHLVESDFDLTKSILDAIDRAGAQYPAVWKKWASEMFADVYGCCAMGPAFAGSMIDLNVTSVRSVRQENCISGAYPTRNLRVRLLCEVLKQTEHQSAADHLWQQWEDVYGKEIMMNDYMADVPRIALALLDGPYRGLKLREIIQFPPEWAEVVKEIATKTLKKRSIDGYTDPRPLFAAAQWLHENPNGAERNGYADLVAQIVTRTENNGAVKRDAKSVVRGKFAPLRFLDKMIDLRKVEKKDREDGRKLRQLFFTSPTETVPTATGQPDLNEL